jgi:hypothetical protein
MDLITDELIAFDCDKLCVSSGGETPTGWWISPWIAQKLKTDGSTSKLTSPNTVSSLEYRFSVKYKQVKSFFQSFRIFYNAVPGWEADITQSPCTGTGADVQPPYSGTKNHMARCGYINRFSFGSGGCEINEF